MEEETAVIKVGKFSSGSYYAPIDKDAVKKLGLDRGTKLVLMVDSLKHRLIYEVVRTTRIRLPPIVEGER